MFNMEFMFYILMFQNFRVILALFLNKIRTYFNIESPLFLKFYGLVSDQLFYSVFHSIGIEAILEWTICIYLNLEKPIFSTGGEIFSFLLAIYAFLLLYIFIPGSMVYVYTRDSELLEDKEFEEKWGAIYEFLSLKRKGALYYMVYYFIQKIAFFFSVFFIKSLPLQIILLYF